MIENDFRFDWELIKNSIKNNWTFSEGSVIYNPDQLDEMAIGIAGDIDKEIKKMALSKLEQLQRQMELFRDDFHGYSELFKRNISQNDEIVTLKQEHYKTIENIFNDIYSKIKRDFELVRLGDWDKSWIRKDIIKLKEKYVQ